MSDLNDLSAPIEESQEEISKKEVKIKQIEKTKVKEDLKKSLQNFKQKYSKKLLLSLGIAVTVCVIIIFALSQLFSPPVDDWPENKQGTPKEGTSINQEDSIKYTKFDGHQYFFYFPENYGFLNRTRNDDLNEVVFSYENGETAFLLQEFEADNDNEETLDSIYSYIVTTLPPDENTEIKFGENTFKHRVYKVCITPEAETGEALSEPYCGEGYTYYSIYINGVIIIFEILNLTDNNIGESLFPTFAKNVVTPQVLSDEYISTKLPTIKNKLQAHFAFGVPLQVEEKPGNITEISWQTTGELKIILGFDSSKLLVYSHGVYNDKFKFDMEDGISNSTASVAYENLMANPGIKNEILKKNPVAHFFMDDNITEDSFWEVKILSSWDNDSILIAEYTVDKTTGQVKSLTD